MNSNNYQNKNWRWHSAFHPCRWIYLIIFLSCLASASRAQYCVPTGMSPWSSYCAGGTILNVKFANLNNSAPCVASSNSADYYKNLTTTVAPAVVEIGKTYALSVQHSNIDAGTATVWIDFNRNQVFDASEKVLTSTSTSVGGTLSGNILIPSNAVAGTTRMRVVGRESASATNPCNPAGYSEVEDYAVIINGGAYNNAAIKSYPAIGSFCSGPSVTKDISVRVANTGKNLLNTVNVDWQVDGVSQPTFSFAYTIDTVGGTGVNDTLLTIGTVAFPTSTPKTIKVWTSLPNGTADTTNIDDTVQFVMTPSISGSFTIGTSGADFPNLTQAIASLQSGVCGPVVFNYIGAAQVYNERVVIGNITGASATNTITINGNGNTIQVSGSSGSRDVIKLEGARYVTIDSLVIKTLNTTYGWGIHFISAANNNTIRRCIIDISSVTSATAANSAGIVFSASTSGITTAAAAGANGSFNVIDNNLIIGNPTGSGMNIGIALTPASAATSFTANQVTNNIIRNFYAVGIYGKNTNGSLIKNNLIENTTKTSVDGALYGISMNTQYRSDSITGNTIRGLAGASSSTINDMYGIYFTNSTSSSNLTPVGNEVYIMNNVIYNFRSSGTQYGIYSSNGTNARYYHNTIVLDDANASASPARGFYYTGSTSGNGIQFFNNIVSVTRAGTGDKHAVFINSAISVYSFGNNAYWVSGTNARVGSFSGTSYVSLNAWKAARPIDQLSRFASPDFTSIAGNNLRPTAGILSNFAAVLNANVTDKDGVLRGSNPDPGAYEFSPVLSDDAGVYEIVLNGALPVGNYAPSVVVFNAGLNPLNSVDINWEVNGVTQAPINHGSTINSSTFSAPISLSPYPFASGIPYTIKVWTSNPNFSADGKPANDTAILANIYTALPGGLYTINSGAPASATNFQTIDAFIQRADSFGISGPVDVKIIDKLVQGPVTINKQILGSSAQNTIRFYGNDTSQTVITSSTTTTLEIIGVKHYAFHDIRFTTTHASTSNLVQLTNRADSNSIVHCQFALPVSTGSSWEGIYARSCDHILIDSCSFKGGYMGIDMRGEETRRDRYNVVRNNKLDSIYSDGINVWYQNAIVIRKNSLTTIGNGTNTYTVAITIRDAENGYRVEQNTILGLLGGSGINTVFCTAVDGRSVIANNMVRMGTGTNTTLAIRAGSDNNDIVYNSVEVNASGSGNNSTALMVNGSGVNTIVNNILKNTNPGMIFQVNATNLLIDNNCYYHNNAQNTPYSLNGVSYTTFAQLTANRTNDTASIEANPLFVSSSDLRTYNPILNNQGRPVSTVLNDIDDSLRSVSTPDMGVNEYDLLDKEDAGVIAILTPTTPVQQGSVSDVVVVIKNYGVGALTSANVTYMSGPTIQTISYMGSLAEGQTDTVRFLAVNNMGLPIPSSGGFTITAWTSIPNLVADKDFSNDTLDKDYCEPMSGTYTINVAGSGARNFTTFNEAVAQLKCGGVSGAVKLEAASGTYNERIAIPQIAGTSAANTVTFTSATGISADVLLVDSSTHDTNNYIVLFAGADHIYVTNISLHNRGVEYSRVFSYKVTNGIPNDYIYVKGCDVSAKQPASNAINTALFYAGSEENRNLYVINNTITNGGTGINFGGMPVKNQYSNNVVIDSNRFINNVFNAVVLSYRNGFDVNRNLIQSTSAGMANGISLYEVCGNANVSQNNISMVQGTGIRVNRYAFYNETGSANVTSNAVLLSGTADLNQMGIALMSASKVSVHNNTIKVNSSKTTFMYSYLANYGLYLQAEPVASNLQNVAMFGNRILNNIIHTEDGYPLYVDDVAFGSGTNHMTRLSIVEINNNLYHNVNGANVAFVVNTSYAKTNFNAFKNIIRTNSDSISRYLKVPFTPGSLKPLESDTIAWWINGRALHNTLVANDVTNKTRATIPYDGVPDIGAYEITPTSLPPLAVAVPANPAAGITQVFLFMGDTVAKITYDVSATAPSSVEVRQYVGERPPQISANQKFMYTYITVEMPSGTYFYNAEQFYKDAWTGTMSNNEASIGMISRDPLGYWSMATGANVDAVKNIMYGYNFTHHNYVLTGTDPLNPLPVKLTSFTARKTADRQVDVVWTVAAERNVSHYVVERSIDGVSFENAGKVPARNASTYRLTDDAGKLSVSQLYYRLTVVDRDGSTSSSKLVKVVFDESGAHDIVIAPNPVNTSLNIYFGASVQEPVVISVYGLQGEKISEQTYNAASSVSQNVSALKPGLYFVKVTQGDVVKTIRFIKD